MDFGLPFLPLDLPLLGDPISTFSTFTSFPVPKQIIPTDISNLYNPFSGGADFSLDITGQQLASDQDLITSITLSLFANRLALPSDELPNLGGDRQGWWADPYLIADPNTAQRVGSRLWLLSRAKSSPALLPVAKQYVEEALQWLTTMKVASSFTVDTFFIVGDLSKLGINIVILRKSKTPLSLRYNWAWQQVQVG